MATYQGIFLYTGEGRVWYNNSAGAESKTAELSCRHFVVYYTKSMARKVNVPTGRFHAIIKTRKSKQI